MKEEFSDKTKSLVGLLVVILMLAYFRSVYPTVVIPFWVMVGFILLGVFAQDVATAFRRDKDET